MTRFGFAAIFSLAMALPASAAPIWSTHIGPLWRHGSNAIAIAPCPKGGGDYDDTCRALMMTHAGQTIPLNAGYMQARIVWQKSGNAAGPDVLVVGDYGGSGGVGDLFAVTFSPKLQVRKLDGEDIAEIVAEPGTGALRFDLPFTIQSFNGASHAARNLVPLPMHWAGGEFALDFKTLTASPFPPADIAFRRLAVTDELSDWAHAGLSPTSLFPPMATDGTPVTVQALAELMLSGHADVARQILDDAWPRTQVDLAVRVGGEDAFWSALCKRIAGSDTWRTLGLSRLPHTDLIVAGAGVQ